MVITVWVLVGFMGISGAGGPIVVDNIASQEDCNALKASLEGKGGFRNGMPLDCHAVPKVVGAKR